MDSDVSPDYADSLKLGDLFTVWRDVYTHRATEHGDAWIADLDGSILVVKGAPLITVSKFATVYRTKPPWGDSDRDEEYYAEALVHIAYAPEGHKVIILNSDIARY